MTNILSKRASSAKPPGRLQLGWRTRLAFIVMWLVIALPALMHSGTAPFGGVAAGALAVVFALGVPSRRVTIVVLALGGFGMFIALSTLTRELSGGHGSGGPGLFILLPLSWFVGGAVSIGAAAFALPAPGGAAKVDGTSPREDPDSKVK